MPSWEVVYKATADFADLIRKAKEADTTLKRLQQTAKAEADTEIKGANEAALAHDRDTKAIERQSKAMDQAVLSAQAYNRFVNQGGRSSKDQYLGDLQRETQQQGLLNRARQRNFVSPQQDYAFRQQEIQQRKLLGFAERDGLQTPDQYLNYRDNLRRRMEAENSAWSRRVELIKANVSAYTAHTDALRGTRETATQVAGQGITAQVKTARDALQATVSDIARARLDPSDTASQAFIARLQQTRAAIKALQAETRGLDFEPKGLSSLRSDFEAAQQMAARVFPDIKAKSNEASDGVAAGWEKAKVTFQLVFASMRASAQDAASGVEGRFARTVAAVRGAFSGIGGGGGGGSGVASAFGDFSSILNTAAAAIPGKISLIVAAVLALIQLLPPLSAGLLAVGSAAATLPAFLVAAGGAFGTFQAAIMPAFQALQAYGKFLQAQNLAQSGTIQATMQQASAYHALTDAQFSLSQAVVQGSNQQVVAAHNVAEAQYSLQQAYFAAQMQQMQASMEVAAAYHSLNDAQFSVTQAQYQLNIAWQQAAFSMQQLLIQVNYASVNLRGAQLNLEQAQQNYAQVMANSTSTALERAQAAYQIQVAEEALQQVELQNSQNETQLANVRKYGANQVFGVTQAQHALVDAQFAEVQAQKNLIVVQKQAANAQIQAAHAIQDAIFGVQQAYFGQAQSAVTSAHTIADAQFSLHQASQQWKIDMQAGGAAAASAFETFQAAMANISPLARRAVTALEPLFYWANNNWKAQNAFFRAFQGNLSNLGRSDARLIEPLNHLLDAVARALGGVAGRLLTWFTSLANSGLWKVLTRNSVRIVTDLGNAAVVFAQGLAQLAKAAGPLATWIAQGILGFARSFLAWADRGLRPGSMLQVLLREARPALTSLVQLLKSIVDFFLILAGGQPTFSKQGILTGVIPTDTQAQTFQTFIGLVDQLANKILPNLALILQRLSSPQMENAIIGLLTALSTLLLDVVSNPAFQAGFTAFVTAFTLFTDALTTLSPVLGAVFGPLAGALVTISVLRFTGVLGLLGSLRKVGEWVGAIRSAEGWLAKIGAIGGRGTFWGKDGAAATAGREAATLMQEGIVAGAREAAVLLKEAMAAGGKTAGAEVAGGEAAGGKTAGAEIAGAEAAGGKVAGAEVGTAEAAGGAAGGGLLARMFGGGALARFAGPVGWGLLATDLLVKPALQGMRSGPHGQNWWDNPFGGFNPSNPRAGGSRSNPLSSWSGLSNWLDSAFGWVHSIPGFGGGSLQQLIARARAAQQASQGGMTHGSAVSAIFGKAPGATGGLGSPAGLTQAWSQFFARLGAEWKTLWSRVHQEWYYSVFGPASAFFTHEMPAWLAAMGQRWKVVWGSIHQGWYYSVWGPVSAFFNREVPAWLQAADKSWGALWTAAWSGTGGFNTQIIAQSRAFFTATLPGWFTQVEQQWGALWTAAWSGTRGFHSLVVQPMTSFFTTTLPSLIESAFKDSMNWVIVNVINKTITDINNVVGKVTGVPQIKLIQTLASGGSVQAMLGSVAGTGTGDRQDAKLTAGEWVLREPARRALDRRFGHGFLPFLNQADRHLGYAGGGPVGSGGSASSLWSHTITPLERRQGIIGEPFGGVVTNLTAKDLALLKAYASFLSVPAGGGKVGPLPGLLPGGGTPAANAALARRMYPAWSTGLEWASWNGLEMGEAGWNQFARNSQSGAYGIPQALPPTKMPFAAQAAGGSHANAQIAWMIAYLKSVYKDPINAYRMWLSRSPHWYHEGGPVQHHHHHRKDRDHGGTGGNKFPAVVPPSLTPPAWTPPPVGGMDLSSFLPWLPDQFYAAGGPVGMPEFSFAHVPSLRLSRPRLPAMVASGAAPERAMSPAAASAAGTRAGGFNVDSITINNPVPERAGDSLTRTVMKLQFLAGRQPV